MLDADCRYAECHCGKCRGASFCCNAAQFWDLSDKPLFVVNGVLM